MISAFDGFADQDKRHKHDKIIHTPDAFAAERDVVNRQGRLIADFERHASSLERKRAGKRFFA